MSFTNNFDQSFLHPYTFLNQEAMYLRDEFHSHLIEFIPVKPKVILLAKNIALKQHDAIFRFR
jgi:hypothetical protein